MDQEPDHRIDELEDQMEAAGLLIKGLEEEVEGLRRDLDQASVALRTAQLEISAREQALEDHDLARRDAEQQARSLRDAMGNLRMQNSDEQLQLRNRHIAELARMQDRSGAQRISDTGKKFSGDGHEDLREEYQADLHELQQRYQRDVEALESSYAEWQDELLEDKEDFKGRHEAGIQELRRETEEQKKELRRQLREENERRLEEVRQQATSYYKEEVEALREGFGQMERELQGEREALIEEHQAALETLQEQADRQLREADEKSKGELREIKALAENRERELRRTQSVKLKEANEEAERRIASLQAQRKADNEALRSSHSEEVARLKEHEEHLNEEVERRQQEVFSLEERFESLKLERISEAQAYIDRLKELEASRQNPQNGQAGAGVETGRSDTGSEDREVEISDLRGLVTELEEALAASRSEAERLDKALEKEKSESDDDPITEPRFSEDPADKIGERAERLEVSPPGAEANSSDRLEAQLREAQKERRSYADELGKALDKLRRLSDPEHRLRAGIEAFNESHHARNVASISKALGLPGVRAGVEGDAPGKPTFTFVWEISWRRYIAEPIEELEEPRVYLVGSGDDPEQFPPPSGEPNARIDARGRLILGIQDR